MNPIRKLGWLAAVTALVVPIIACSGNGGESDAGRQTATPTESTPTPAPPDSEAGRRVFAEFVAAVTANDLNTSWALYTASIAGSTKTHRDDLGCDFLAFSDELPRINYLFSRLSPLEVQQTFGASEGSQYIELRVLGADGEDYLATVQRAQPFEQYRMRFFNSGDVSKVPGAPDPLPSPEYPRGYCGIWSGGR
jgi:hypothetical protein